MTDLSEFPSMFYILLFVQKLFFCFDLEKEKPSLQNRLEKSSLANPITEMDPAQSRKNLNYMVDSSSSTDDNDTENDDRRRFKATYSTRRSKYFLQLYEKDQEILTKQQYFRLNIMNLTKSNVTSKMGMAQSSMAQSSMSKLNLGPSYSVGQENEERLTLVVDNTRFLINPSLFTAHPNTSSSLSM